MGTQDLLPTRDKSKLPQDWVHPVGAQVVSRAFGGIGQYEHIYLRFLGATINAKQSEYLYVLSAHYTPPDMSAMKENWWVDVSAVPKSVAARVKEALLSEGLPQVRSWVESKHTPVWLNSWKSLYVLFELNTQRLVFRQDGAA